MSMSYRFLNAEREVVFSRNRAACFMEADREYLEIDINPRYFKFMFPKGDSTIRKVLSKKYILSLKEIYDFGQYMTEPDWKEGSITFDLTTVPGHRIFAICTCIRMIAEYPDSVFVAWKILSNPKFFEPLSAIEKFVLMHPLSNHLGGDEHHLYNTSKMKGLCEEFISYKPVFRRMKSYYKSDGGSDVLPKFDLPYEKNPFFRSVSLHVSYAPPGFDKEDLSFVKYLKKKALSKEPLEKLHAWNNDASLL